LKPSAAAICYFAMKHNVFLLATDPNDPGRDVIHARDTELKLRVFCLENEPFYPNSNEIQLYGSAGSKLFAFETIDIASDDALDIVEAIQWYAGYIDCPEMDIVPEDPRADREAAL
jgi:hypothetical protein